MEIEKAMKEAKNQITQAGYLCECSNCKTGLKKVWENKWEMLIALVAEIEILRQEKAEREKGCEICKIIKFVDSFPNDEKTPPLNFCPNCGKKLGEQ